MDRVRLIACWEIDIQYELFVGGKKDFNPKNTFLRLNNR